MARTPKRNAAAGQYALPIRDERGPSVGPGFLPPASPDGPTCHYVEMGPAEFDDLLRRSNLESKDRGRLDADPSARQDAGEDEGEDQEGLEREAIRGFGEAFASGDFVPAGDPIVLGPLGAMTEGIKRCIAGRDAGAIVRMLVVQGVSSESRFSTDDTLKATRTRRRPAPPPEPAGAAPVDLTGLRPVERAAIDRAFRLRDAISTELGYPVLGGWTAEALASGIDQAGPVATRGVPLHLAIAARAMLTEVAPSHARQVMIAWAFPGLSPPSAAVAFAEGAGRAGSGLDDLDVLATLALAIEATVDGRAVDPTELRAATRRDRRQLLAVLAGRRGQAPDRLVSCTVEEIPVEALRDLLARSGRPFESIDRAELDRIRPLARDVRREGGLALTGQSFKVSAEGRIVDGLDRAIACVMVGKPLRSVVARGFREDHDPVRMRGRKQSLGHRLYADGDISPYDIQALLLNVHRMSENDREARATNTSLRHLQRKHPQAARTVMFVHELKPYMKVSWISPAHVAMSRYSRDLADTFCAELLNLVTGRTARDPSLVRHDVLLAMMEELDRVRADGPRGQASDDRAVCVIVEAMNAWCAERPVERFRPLPRAGYLRIEEPPQVARKKREFKERTESARPDPRDSAVDDALPPPGPR